MLLALQTAKASKISLGSVVIDFKDSKTKFIDVPVYNTNEDGSKAFVKTSVFEVIDAGTDKEKRIKVGKNKKQSLIVSPQKMVIPFKGQKNIRFVSLYTNLEKDKIFRVKVEPIIGKATSKAKQAVKVLVAYETLVIIRPQEPKPLLDAKRNGKKIFFQNNGNTNILIRGATHCPSSSADPEKCKEIPGVRLYAGGSQEMTLPFDSKVDFTININGKNEVRTY